MTPTPPAKKEWPRFALSPAGQRAKFDCMGDIPIGWTLEQPLAAKVPQTLDGDPNWDAPVKRGPGRPPKAA